MKSLYSDFVKNSLYSFMGSFGSKIIMFLALPFFTHYLTPREFGLIDTFQISAFLMGMVLDLQLQESLFFDAKKPEANQPALVSTYVFSVLVTFSLASVISVLVGPRFFAISLYDVGLFLAFLLPAILMDGLAKYFASQNRFKIINLASILYTFLFITLATVSIVGLGWDYHGYLLALVIAQWLCVLMLAVQPGFLRLVSPSAFSPGDLRRMLGFSLPLVPAQISGWVLSFADRYMILWIVGAAALGELSIATKAGTIMALFIQLFAGQFKYAVAGEFSGPDSFEERNQVVSRLFEYIARYLSLATSLLLLIIKPGFALILSAEFAQSAYYAPLLVLAALIRSLPDLIGSLYKAVGRTRAFLNITMVSMGLYVALCLALIPLLGIAGSILSGIGTFLVLFAALLYFGRHFFQLRLNEGVYVLAVVLACQTATCYVDSPVSIWLNAASFLVVVMLCRDSLVKLYVKFMMPALQRLLVRSDRNAV